VQVSKQWMKSLLPLLLLLLLLLSLPLLLLLLLLVQAGIPVKSPPAGVCCVCEWAAGGSDSPQHHHRGHHALPDHAAHTGGVGWGGGEGGGEVSTCDTVCLLAAHTHVRAQHQHTQTLHTVCRQCQHFLLCCEYTRYGGHNFNA
jgi:hypothetical protein